MISGGECLRLCVRSVIIQCATPQKLHSAAHLLIYCDPLLQPLEPQILPWGHPNHWLPCSYFLSLHRYGFPPKLHVPFSWEHKASISARENKPECFPSEWKPVSLGLEGEAVPLQAFRLVCPVLNGNLLSAGVTAVSWDTANEWVPPKIKHSSFAQEMSAPLRQLKSDVQSNSCHHLNYRLSSGLVIGVRWAGAETLVWAACHPGAVLGASAVPWSVQSPGIMPADQSNFCLLIGLPPIWYLD